MPLSRIAEAYVQIVPRIDGVGTQVRSQLAGELAAAGDGAGDAMAGGVASSFGSKIKGYIAPVIAGFAATFAATGLTNLVKDSVKAASDYGESTNAIKVAYGEAASGIAALGSDAATRLGLTSTQFNQIATQFSAFGKTIAGSGGDVVGVIDDLSSRGADFASVFNIEVNDALALFQSGLAGETEPLRKYGIDLSAAAVEHYALAKGIIHGKEKMTEAQKVQARYGLLMESTAMTAGDFANTSGGLANQQRILTAQTEELKRKFGDSLLPVLTNLASFANTTLIPAITAVGQFFSEYGAPIAAFAGTIAVLTLALNAQAIATAITTSATWAWTAALLANPITWIVVGIAALVAGIVLLATKTTFFQDVWAAMTKFFTEAWNNVVKFFSAAWTNITNFFKSALDFIVRMFMDWSLWGLVIKLVTWIVQNWGKIGQFFATVWNNIVAFFATAWSNITTGVSNGINTVIKFFSGMGAQIIGVLSGAGKWLVDTGKNLIQGLLNGAGSLLKNIGNFFLKMLPGWIVDPFKAALGIRSPSRVFREFGKNILEGLIQGLTSDEEGVLATMKKVSDWVSDALFSKELSKRGAAAANALVAVYSSRLQSLASEHDKVVEKLKAAQEDLANQLKAKADLVKSLTDKYGAGYTLDEKTTAAMAIQQLKDRIAKSQELKTVTDQLVAMGLNKDLYKQIIEAGAVDFAKSIVEGGSEAVSQLNVLANEADTQAAALAERVGSVLFDEGIKFAQSVVDGLLSQEQTLSSMMARVADEFATRISAVIKAGAAQAAAENTLSDAKAAAAKAQAAYDKAVKGKGGKNSKAAKNAAQDLAAANKAVTNAKAALGKTSVPTFGGSAILTDSASLLSANAVQMPNAPATGSTGGAVSGQTIIYNAAPNNSLDSERDLFTAIQRARIFA